MNILLWILASFTLVGTIALYGHIFYQESPWLEWVFQFFLPWADEFHEIVQEEEWEERVH